jgi:predicted ATPase/DNA-binding SARP family transcriptional activator
MTERRATTSISVGSIGGVLSLAAEAWFLVRTLHTATFISLSPPVDAPAAPERPAVRCAAGRHAMDNSDRSGLDIRLLGPATVAVDGREIAIGSPKQRVVLAMLALSRRVTVDAFADELWRETPPASVAATVQTLVSRLRKALADAGADLAIRYEPGAYALEVDPGCVDVHRFHQAVAEGRRALEGDRPDDAADHLRRALALWRGPALEEFSERDFARLAASRLDEARVAAGEDLTDAELAAGRPSAALEVLAPLITAHPFRERLRAQQMTALYRLGRQADALASYQELRRILSDELGLDPSPALRELERAILQQSASLGLEAARPPREAAPESPTEGTLAFLFTDIEASTGRWEGGRAAMSADLASHDAVLSEAVAAHSGRVFTHTGDGLGAAFPTAVAALGAAIDGQLALAGVGWRGTAPLRVRMAIHVGAAEARAGTFLGPTLNRVARLLDEAAGGEIVCSQAAAALVSDDLPEPVTLVDLGDRQLEGLSRPERVWQVTHAALPVVRPPTPPPADAASFPLTTFVGREAELAELCELLPETRLLTIAGVGGAGKTRLALELAARMSKHFDDGHAVVELASVTEARLLAPGILSALGVEGVAPAVAEEQLLHVLARRRLLLVLDNCEHVLEPVAALAHRLLGRCDTVTLLATSREVLSVPGETVWMAPGLSLPPAGAVTEDDLEGSDAASLFVTRARTARPGFGATSANAAAVASICRRLDGLPLALELAAARVRVLGVAEIAERLDDRFRLLTGGPRSSPARHQTLRAAMEWSFELLAAAERQLLVRLGVFPQSFDLAAATAVAGEGKDELDVLDLLARLIDKSLIVPEGAAATARYRLLETVRQYGAEVLAASGDEADVRRVHRRHFVDWIKRTFRPGDNNRPGWLHAVNSERENCNAALTDALADGDMESTAILVAGTYGVWFWWSSFPEIIERIDPKDLRCTDPSLMIEAHLGVFWAGFMSGRQDWVAADRIFRQALAHADEEGGGWEQGWLRYLLGYAARSQGDVTGARQWQEAARDRLTAETKYDAFPHFELGWIDMTEDAIGGALAHFRDGLALIDGTPGEELMELHIRAALALAEAAHGDAAEALAHARTAVETARRIGVPGLLGMALIRAAETATVAGAPQRSDLAEALQLLWDQASPRWVAAALTLAALHQESAGAPEVAARLLGGAAAIAEAMGEKPQPLPVIARLVAAAEARLAGVLGPQGLAQYLAAGRSTSVPGLLQTALAGVRAQAQPVAPKAL